MTIRGTNAHPARSGTPPSFADFVPAANISFVGVGFRDAAYAELRSVQRQAAPARDGTPLAAVCLGRYSYLAPHGNPSGGDWGLHSPGLSSSGAVMLEVRCGAVRCVA